MANKQTFPAKELKCESVVVFADRAELRRVLKTKLKKGENEILVNGVSNSIDRDSVRLEGHGNATVVDVVCQSRSVVESNKIESSDSKEKDLRNEIKDLEVQIERKNQQLSRTDRQINILNDFADTLSKPVAHSGPAGGQINLATLNSSENVNNFMNFINLYSSKSENLDSEKSNLQKEIKELREKLDVARDNLNKLIGYPTYNEVM